MDEDLICPATGEVCHDCDSKYDCWRDGDDDQRDHDDMEFEMRAAEMTAQLDGDSREYRT